MKRLFRSNDGSKPRDGFTLVEMLIVISIILILLTLTLVTFRFNSDSDRVKRAARQVQSFLLGAKDRAIKRGEEVGVRFYFGQPSASADATATQIIARQVTGMAYIARSGTWPPIGQSGERVRIERTDQNGDGDTDDAGEASLFSSRTDWWTLKRRGWLVDGLRIRIPNSSTGIWYQLDTSTIDITIPPPDTTELRLITPLPNKQAYPAPTTYSIELPWSMLPEEPSILPEDVVIDLDGSRVPASWRPVAATDLYREFVDVIFTPRGNVTGDAAAAGLLHFYVCDQEDSLTLKDQLASTVGFANFNANVAAGAVFVPMDEVNQPWSGGPYNVKPRRLVTVRPQTGGVSVHDVHAYIDPETAVDPGDQNGDGVADDPFRFAETGEAAN